MDKKDMSCVDCRVYACARGGRYPDFCVTANMPQEPFDSAMQALKSAEDNPVAVAAAEVECEGYCRRTRVEEVIMFARKIGAKKLGIATCVGLMGESQTLAAILRKNGFEVYGAACKAGAVPKTEIGIPEKCEAVGKNMCNPVLQAKLLNAAGTDLNLIMGLCVGHDSLFMKYSDALCTAVVTKDRVLAHNPVAALYQADKYYKRLLNEEI